MMNNKTAFIPKLSIGGFYKHYKGNTYKVLEIARHSEDLSYYVVYQALYGDFGIWVRPLEMFLETVNIEGVEIPRFALIQKED